MEGKKVPMEYRYLGNTGIKVSVLGLGNMMTNYDQAGEDAQNEIVKVALDAGVNFFDTAEMYGGGEGERMLGRTIKKFDLRRQDIVITNKIFRAAMGPTRVAINEVGRLHFTDSRKWTKSMLTSYMPTGRTSRHHSRRPVAPSIG